MAQLKKTTKNNKKLVVIGLDGGTFDVIDLLIEDNKLSNIKNLIEKGNN